MSEKIEIDKEELLKRLVPIILVLTVVLAFMAGILWQKVSNLEKGTEKPTVAGTETAPDQPQPLAEGKLSEDQAAKIPGVTDKDHIRGASDAKVLLIEYSDMECPFCKRFHETMIQTMDEFGGQVAWVYRHFPLDFLHTQARTEAMASECAAELGGNDGFWNLVDKIYETTTSNDGLDLDTLPGLAAQVGLDEGAFQTCLDSEGYADRVESDYQGGIGAGVTGTPASFIVNDKGEAWFVAGAAPFEAFKEKINEALQD